MNPLFLTPLTSLLALAFAIVSCILLGRALDSGSERVVNYLDRTFLPLHHSVGRRNAVWLVRLKRVLFYVCFAICLAVFYFNSIPIAFFLGVAWAFLIMCFLRLDTTLDRYFETSRREL